MPFDPKKTALFQKKLLDYFKKSGREHLPWRKKKMTAYAVWVSEIMLQQTQVSRVIGYYERFLKRFPTVEKLAKVSWEEFLPYYAGLGYYSRGRNMLRTAQAVMHEYEGKFPTSVPELEKLPGVGPYTARAIASFATGAPYLAWDTNLLRVMGRFFRGGKQLLREADKLALERRYSKEAPLLNAALMDFGSSICVARPKCGACMLRPYCRYAREKGKGEVQLGVPQKKKGNSLDGARAMVYLHEAHKQYFSAEKKRYRPFVLPKGYQDRQAIKEYFRTHFQLELSVRPSHGSITVEKQTFLLVNAQILLGEPLFTVFPKSAVLEYNKSTFS